MQTGKNPEKNYQVFHLSYLIWGCLKSLFNRKELQGIRKAHKGKSLILIPMAIGTLRT